MQEKISSFLRIKWALLLYTGVSIVCALSLSFYAQDVGLRLFDFVAQNQEKKLITYLRTEGDSIIEKVSTFSARDDVKESLRQKDVSRLTELLEQAKISTGLMAFTAADAQGVALSRFPVKANLGDNVFLTLPIGRIASQGATAITYGPGRNFSLTMASGHLVQDKGILLGAVFGGHWFNSSYAKAFKTNYLSSFLKQEVIFYSKEEGMTGSSFESIDVQNKLSTYVTHASPLIQEGRSGDLININGKDYIVTNHLLSGGEEVYGGILLLTPLPKTLLFRSLVMSFVLTLLFLISLLLVEKVTVPELLRFKKKHLYWLLLILSLIVLVTLWMGIYLHGKSATMQLDKPKFAIYNSTIKLRPEAGVYTMGHTQQVSIVVSSGGEEINAVKVGLHFNPKVIHVDSVSFDRSICTPETIIENNIDNTEGTISVSCVITEKVFSDIRGVVADINFTPVKFGDAAITFTDDTHVLAADGLGTEVLRSMTSGFYRVFDDKDLEDSFSKNTLIIPYSPTHENSSRWYSSNNITVAWPKVEGADYLYEFSEDATTTFSNPKKIHANEIKIVAPHDGVYYFKLAAKKGDVEGLISRLKIKIDTTAPGIPLIKVSNLSVIKDNVVRFELSSDDESSGLQKNFYVQVDGSVWLPSFAKLYMPFHDKGSHIVGVRVFDNAENYSESEVRIRVKN
ncbi:MAG: hypothetical protein WC444_03765 [Candidatus Paceibacterota bacterium]